MSWIASSGPSTVTAMLAELGRPSASEIVHAIAFAPGVAVTVTESENTLSPDAASPCVPSSKNACGPEPPIAVRSHTTASPVLGGFVPNVTSTSSRVAPPAGTDEGVAEPTPVGELQKCTGDAEFRGVGAPAVKSAPFWSVSTQPPFRRESDAVAEMVGAADAPSKKFAPLAPVP